MVQVHHAAASLASVDWANKEIIGELNFRLPELPADLVALGSDEDVAALKRIEPGDHVENPIEEGQFLLTAGLCLGPESQTVGDRLLRERVGRLRHQP